MSLRRLALRVGSSGAAACLGVLLVAPLADATLGRELPKRFKRAPFAMMSLTVGHPNDGWQVRAKRLRRTRHLTLKLGSEDHAYGHPALVLMLKRSAKELARAAPGSVMLVGDLSSKPGGPLAGHRSHQSGRDADVAFYALDPRGKPATLERFVSFGGDGAARDGSGLTFDDRRNWLLVQSWVRDDRAGLSHIFVSSSLRQRLLGYAAKQPAFRRYVTEVAALLKQPEDAEPHDDHFHVRVSCPKDQNEICREGSK